jgi:hypothetical protein
MKAEIQRLYSTFLTRTHRKPRTTPADELPVLIGAPDLQVYKKDPTSFPLILCNSGLHFNGLLMVPPDIWLTTSLIRLREHPTTGRDRPHKHKFMSSPGCSRIP